MELSDYIRNGKPTDGLKLARQQIEQWLNATGDDHGIDLASWPDEVVANLDMNLRTWLADEAGSCEDPYDVQSDYGYSNRYSCITSRRHEYLRQMLFDRAKDQLQPVTINGKSYSISAARDYLDARENARAS